MTKIKYEDWNPRPKTLDLVDCAERIIREYQHQGLVLTLRQLYYQFVARDVIPNTERSYKNLGNIIRNARMAGMISWKAIEDRNRGHNEFWVDESADNCIDALPRQIRFDQWVRQDHYVEVWVEKEALGNVIEQACNPLLVPYMSCKGYLSASEAWRAGRRVRQQVMNGKECTIIHLGDHDPSGIDMTRDNQDRLDCFSGFSGVNVNRISLNMDQIEQYSPPPNPTKFTDSRAKEYAKKFGNESWELDALEPKVLINLIKDTIEPMIDWNVWDETLEEEKEVKAELHKLSNNWSEVQDFLSTL